MPKLVSIDDQRYAALTLQSLRVTIGPLQASTTSLESQESYLTAGMLSYNRNVTLQTFLSSTRDFYRLHSTFARLYNAAASPASRLRSAGSLAITVPTSGSIGAAPYPDCRVGLTRIHFTFSLLVLQWCKSSYASGFSTFTSG